MVETNGQSTIRRSPAHLRQAGIIWLQHHHTLPEPAFRRFALPWVTLVVTLRGSGEWRKAGEGWRAFPKVALRGHATSWSEGRDLPGQPVEYLAVLIEPWAVSQMFGIPARLLRDDVLDLESAPGLIHAGLRDRLSVAVGAEAKLDLLASVLMARIADPARADPQVARFLALCRAQAGSVMVHDFARRIDTTPRRFRALFRDSIGVSPKPWAMLERFTASARALHPRSWDLRDYAEPDYFDEAQAIHEFRRHSGLTPGAYRREKRDGDARVFVVTCPPLIETDR
ncbi:MAG TPA: AraC family transcriptional regulator [Allosphingosinicella sp.]